MGRRGICASSRVEVRGGERRFCRRVPLSILTNGGMKPALTGALKESGACESK